MKTIFLLLGVLALTSCGQRPINGGDLPSPAWVIPLEFQSLVSEFYSYYGTETGGLLPQNLVIKKVAVLSSGNSSTIGVCYYLSGNQGYPLIEIKASWWDTDTTQGRRALLFHEMGHCLLHRDHTSTTAFSPTINGNVPTSIMYPYIITSFSNAITNFYTTNLALYIHELFDPSRMGTITTAINNYGSVFDPNHLEPINGLQETSEDGECTLHLTHE